MKPLIIYHGNCSDGFAAVWCFWRKHLYDADYFPGVYQSPAPSVLNRDVVMVDFSYKRETIQLMLLSAKSITILDHHKSAMADLAGLDHPNLSMHFDMNRSGATIAWDYLYPGEPRPALLAHVEDRDLWRFKLPLTREIHAAVTSYPFSFEQWSVLMASQEEELHSLALSGEAIERKHHKDIGELVEECKRRMVIGGYSVPVACLPGTMASDAGHLMAQNEPFSACYYDTADHRKFSLRSDANGGLDVSLVAALYGGGGHARAAGFRVPRDHDLAKG